MTCAMDAFLKQKDNDEKNGVKCPIEDPHLVTLGANILTSGNFWSFFRSGRCFLNFISQYIAVF